MNLTYQTEPVLFAKWGVADMWMQQPMYRLARACTAGSIAMVGVLFLHGAAFADAARKTAVVELFTSQGCKSCPQADVVFNDLAENPDIVALSFHVTYWDYLGWRDTLATKENTARQNAYRDSFKSRMIYTPQAVINGEMELNGRDEAGIRRQIDNTDRNWQGMNVPVSATRTKNNSIEIEVGSGKAPKKPVHLVLFYFNEATVVPITFGENAGHSVTYRNAVHSIETIGMWDGNKMRVEIPASELEKKRADGFAVLLQEAGESGPGMIHGAAIYKPHLANQ